MNADDDVTTSLCPRCKRKETIIRDKVTFGNSVEDVVAEMRFKIEQATGLTASAGWFIVQFCILFILLIAT